MGDLRDRVQKLAVERPDFRSVLVPLLKKTAGWRDILRLIQKHLLNPTDESLGDLSDYAVNVLRDEGLSLGYGSRELGALAREELPRFRGLRPTQAGLVSYLKAPRVGSRFRMTRKMRAALFAQMVARGVVK